MVKIFLQARLNSSRLPQKIIKSLLGKPLICRIIERLAIIDTGWEVIVATSESSCNVLTELLSPYPVYIFAGEEEDVLARYYRATQQYPTDIIVRATADNLFVSLKHLKDIVKLHLEYQAELSHFVGLPVGSGVEVFNLSVLEKVYHLAKLPYQREHLTTYIYENRLQFKILEPLVEKEYYYPDIRLTIDQSEDFELALKLIPVLEKYSPNWDIKEICLLIASNPELFSINSHIKQIVPAKEVD